MSTSTASQARRHRVGLALNRRSPFAAFGLGATPRIVQGSCGGGDSRPAFPPSAYSCGHDCMDGASKPDAKRERENHQLPPSPLSRFPSPTFRPEGRHIVIQVDGKQLCQA